MDLTMTNRQRQGEGPQRNTSDAAPEPFAWLAALFELTAPKEFDAAALADLREQFLRCGYVKLPSFLTPVALEFLKAELERLETSASRRAFEMPGYNTPRSLSVLGGTTIKAQSPLLFGLYHHSALRTCVERVAGRTVYPCQHPEEFMVANLLHRSGDTHGWHLDDPAFALVLFIDAPPEGQGGELEMIANWTDLCRRKGRRPDEDIADLIAWAADNNLVERSHHAPGDAYLLRADINLHRVRPITGADTRRCVLNLAFQANVTAKYSQTANLLYA